MNMIPSFLSPLIELQSLDMEVETTIDFLQRVSEKIQTIEQKIKDIEGEWEAVKGKCRLLQRHQKEIEQQVQQSHAQIQKYKTQQMVVKKNEEYQALESEIATQQQKIEQDETEELGIMFQIDREEENLAEIEKTFSAQIAIFKNEIQENQEFLCELKTKQKELTQNIDEKRLSLDQSLLADYDQIRINLRKMPIITKINRQTCGGCHLKVSQEVMGQIKDSENLHHCDQCGRIIY